ncbi:ead/Ea22-like family protein [Salmonella enterica]|nr:ead/Ea22-like family protein [Salmonella enterica subsp. enterica serovar Litchfield]EDE3206764.1 ead/Ea22-like family protein [Salmonella enterica subsp. enterica serovar Litchfield]EDN6794003.1 ead/Ea22-like family protein [Salmonella enterica]EDY4123903.1 ead/Ea22-like family protein [Salmonella enterica]EKA6116857.1 ead/Ea22-like family protein [Salmonella enterica]
MTIDKQALRETAEKVNSGNWSYEEFSELGLPGGAHIKIDGRDAIYCLNKPTGGIEQSRAVLAYIAAFNPKVALALLDENIQLQREKDAIEAVALALRDDMRQAREQLEAAEKQVEELTMWVKRLAHSLRNAKPNSKLYGAVMDYLSRKGLISVEDVLR